MCNFNSFQAEGRLNAPLFYFIKIVWSLCSAFDRRQKPITLNTKGNQRILKVSESLSELTEMTAEAGEKVVSGETTSVRWSGECEFLAELSVFALQESSEATLYK